MRLQPKLLLLAGSVLVVAFLAFSYWMFANQTQAPVPEPAAADAPEAVPSDNQPIRLEPGLDAKLRLSLESTRDPSQRKALLTEVLLAPGATSELAALRACMLTDKEPAVRLHAFEVRRELALREGETPILAVVSDGVKNPHFEVRREALRLACDHPQIGLMSELLRIADQGGQDRYLAVTALAHLDDPIAHERVLQAARSTETPRAERIRAIILLHRSVLTDAIDYLKELARGDDVELAEFAIEALALRQG